MTAKRALLVVGHGSTRRPDAARPTLELARVLGRRGGFDEAATAFWKQPPYLDTVRFRAPVTCVVPNFAGEGLFTRHRIPEALGLAGPETVLDDGRRVLYTRPPMAHPRLPVVLRERLDSVLAGPGIDPRETAVLVVGHGSRRTESAGDTAHRLAGALAPGFGTAVAAFLEQPPWVHDWRSLVGDRPHVVVVPLLMGEGMHGRDDLPPLFNLDPDALASADPVLGPVAAGGREVFYLRGPLPVETAADLALDMIGDGPTGAG